MRYLLLILCTALSGCSTMFNDRTLLYSEGCLLYGEGMEVHNAEDLSRTLNIDDECRIIVEKKDPKK